MTGIAKDTEDFNGACLIFLDRQKNKSALGGNGPRPQVADGPRPQVNDGSRPLVTDGPSDQMQTERQASLAVPGPSNASVNSSRASSDPSPVVLPVSMSPLVLQADPSKGQKRNAEEDDRWKEVIEELCHLTRSLILCRSWDHISTLNILWVDPKIFTRLPYIIKNDRVALQEFGRFPNLQNLIIHCPIIEFDAKTLFPYLDQWQHSTLGSSSPRTAKTRS